MKQGLFVIFSSHLAHARLGLSLSPGERTATPQSLFDQNTRQKIEMARERPASLVQVEAGRRRQYVLPT